MTQPTKTTPGKLLETLLIEWQKAIIGKPETLRLVMINLLCRGHLLLEDLPGLGKTTLAKALARSLDLTFKRIQCTPDLLPADITGISIFDQNHKPFVFYPARFLPIFCWQMRSIAPLRVPNPHCLRQWRKEPSQWTGKPASCLLHSWSLQPKIRSNSVAHFHYLKHK